MLKYCRVTATALCAATLLLSSLSTAVSADDVAGLTSVASQSSVQQTADKLVTILEKKGMTVFNRIDHAKGAQGAGVELPPTQLIIFGNPKIGSQLMLCSQTTAIDLPQKMLIWQDDNGKVWLGYNSPDYLKSRHHIDGCQQILAKVNKALSAFAQAASQ
ncbi:hypothetical protein SIN8267_03540 [Sinobacterium norvegicum]|uniref:DUF302 domain-containing protein n=1 Tax=Sinobacterium norvegicum TaxID=1641715 RepID=A0ABN8ELW8_9GAMM|nr:DUF302 domain-containing protein [Sinobacterium norvegicum]CAH0993391.1 hypothetical protein SIN8267_03540 [Sinobacterium norvegicum]